LRARDLPVATVFFLLGDVVTRVSFGPAATLFNVIVWLDNGVTFLFEFSGNVT
jgi:hypothetical protein